MLDVRLENMLEATPYGFETLTTHLVKCAVAASLAVDKEKRPCLQEVLKKIGFQVDSLSTSTCIKNKWNELATFKVIGSKWENKERRSCQVFRSTYQMKAKLMKARLGPKRETECLIVDKLLFEALKNLRPDPEAYSSPVACVNFGNSPFADGFVTFYVTKESRCNSGAASDTQEPQLEDSPEANNVTRFTIMNQSKDYHTTSLDVTKLQKHSERGKDKLLNTIFGESRLLCVSSSKEVILSKRECQPRDFLPFCADQSTILENLLATLQKQRAKESRLQTHACYCDEDGEQLNEDGERLNEDGNE